MKKIETTSPTIIDLINNFNQKTERLHLKKFSHEEIEFNVNHELNPRLMKYIRDPISAEETYKRTAELAKPWSGEEQKWALLAIRLIDGNDYIGLVCFRYESLENDTVEIGWRLGEQYHGVGYATEAAQCLLDFIQEKIKAHKVTAYCVAENTASTNIMLKLGMQKEAHLREFSKLGGQWFDEAIYAVLLNS